MKLCGVSISNFRVFRLPTKITLDDLTALIGRNDIGKSSVLEALEIFFEGEHLTLDVDDPTKGSNSSEVRIACEFTDLPAEVILDVEARTTLQNEYLLNTAGNLEIEKVFDCSRAKITPQVYARAVHPRSPRVSNLLSMKIQDLRKLFESLHLDAEHVNLAAKPELRRAIWQNGGDLQRRLCPRPIEF